MQSSFIISSAAIAGGASFPAGGVLRIVGASGESQDFEMNSSKILLPFGTWDMYFVGFQGANNWEGPHMCGGVEQVALIEETATVTITASTGNCSLTPYPAIISSKALTPGTWDRSQWNRASWGP